jgi:D-3-phosphoglycerate dehydrogenase / 2-oxoglutarate reductase
VTTFSTAPLAGSGLEVLQSLGRVVCDPWTDAAPPRFLSAEEMTKRLSDLGARFLIVEADFVEAEVFQSCPDLEGVVACRGDPWNVDVGAATANGVFVVRTPGRNANAVAELALALSLELMRGVRQGDADVRRGDFVVEDRIAYQRFLGPELSGRTVGIVGFGAVGRCLSKILQGFGCRILVHDPYVEASALADCGAEAVSLEDLLRSSDVVSLHAVVTNETRGMIGSRELALMRPTTYLINTARADLVDTDALVDVLRSGRLAGAGIDHFAGEFLDPSHPLAAMRNVILTPHIGGATIETIERHTSMAASALSDAVAGRAPTGLVNEEVWERRMTTQES